MSVSRGDFPNNISDEAINTLLLSIGLPKATRITSPRVNASFHGIYMITLPPGKKVTSANILCDGDELVLRVAANYWPRIKTLNEQGVMSFISNRTKIPIPQLIGWDASVDNPLGYEWTLLARVPGETLSDIWHKLDAKQMGGILSQLANIIVELHSLKFKWIGGITSKSNEDDGWIVGQVIDETFWATHQVLLWPAHSSVQNLNIRGPYKTYAGYIGTQVRLYTLQIQMHENLRPYRYLVHPLDTLLDVLDERDEELSKTRFVLAHRDLHFGNIMYDQKAKKITGILDWEFAGVVPAPKWNPRGAFLWNCDRSESGKEMKEIFLENFVTRCKNRGLKAWPDEVEYTSPGQKAMQEIADHLRAIIEVKVRDQYSQDVQMRLQFDERVSGWEKTITEALKVLDIEVPGERVLW
ncbi:kinase-like domain-containing protein [Annulohypoxylon nitens]|nr:kinase-like domain-containing protein [Annulohypoxylon nitens]